MADNGFNVIGANGPKNPFTSWGLEDGRDDLALSRSLTAMSNLKNNGLYDKVVSIMDGLGTKPYDQLYKEMKAIRDQVAAADSDKLTLDQKQNLASTLGNIDARLNEIRRQQSRAAYNEVYNLRKNAYDRAVAQNEIDGTPVNVTDPGSTLQRDIADVGGQIWHGIKRVLPFTDEYGNTETYNRPDAELAYIQQAYGGKPTSSAKNSPVAGIADTITQATNTALNAYNQATTAPAPAKKESTPVTKSTGATNRSVVAKAPATTTSAQQVAPLRTQQQVVPTQTTQPVYQRPTEPALQMGANGYPIYEQLPNGGYRYDTTYLDPQGKVDPYAMPNGIRGDFGDQEAYWNLRNRAAAAKARYEQSQSANLQGEATSGLLQVQADPETHRRAQEYLQSGMALNAQEAMNLAAVEQAQRMGIWGAAANAYAPMQQGLDNAQARNTAAGMYFGANTPYYTSANGYGARTGMNGVTFDSENGTVNVVLPNGQVVTGVNPDRATAGAAAGSPQAAMAARFNAETNFARASHGLYGNPGSFGAPTNAAVMSLATSESNKAAKGTKDNKNTPPSPL